MLVHASSCFLVISVRPVAGEVVWSLQWGEVLAPELRGKPGSPADHVNLHTRMPAPPYDVKCASPSQAQHLLQAVQRQLVSMLHVRIMNTKLNGTSIEDAATPLEQVLLAMQPWVLRSFSSRCALHGQRSAHCRAQSRHGLCCERLVSATSHPTPFTCMLLKQHVHRLRSTLVFIVNVAMTQGFWG